ncbi:hypothetical protein BDN71DRAFT_305659 [Pleurotus eryngii]|uniref:Uncharacterized protein n=1 Tax=Pleurotus eryngii TaxID=5323 RepID=A0A9P6A2A3_PLEER|nr:hypothetical protein BDN71DRAFT_305659 [Pleurotus eryngii]
MQQFRTDVQDVMHHIANLHVRPYIQSISRALARYESIIWRPSRLRDTNILQHVGKWVHANGSWSFESEHYFGVVPEYRLPVWLVYLSGNEGKAHHGSQPRMA